jgi:hypothetical protein
MAMNAVLAMIMVLNAHLVVSQSGPDLPDDFGKSGDPISVEQTAVKLYVTHATFNCPPCRAFDAAVDRGDLANFDVVKSDGFDGLQLYPAIRFKSATSPTGWAVRYGWSAEQLAWLKRNLLPAKESLPVVTAMSHSEMVAIHNRLHGGGSWTWPGDLAQHLRDVHGVPTHALDQNYRESAINSPRVSVRPAAWGPRFFGRSRTSYRFACPSGRCP